MGLLWSVGYEQFCDENAYRGCLEVVLKRKQRNTFAVFRCSAVLSFRANLMFYWLFDTRLVYTFLKNYSSNNSFFCALTILAICNPHVIRATCCNSACRYFLEKIIPLIILFFVH